MVRFLFLAALLAIAVAAVAYVATWMAGRPFVSDAVGRVLVALVIAGVALLLFGGGWLWN
ncbi:hypothetical protein GRZ55_12355 [Chelativorans sp. ZYF759]|uniref:hypothetical protein n=1 Tax=Chelativorans sp. ZYF759 TaxID=2692213 RepID=UPI00145DD2B7|nr:hypothetical protein [Chelativorans sp. ZYF759]NMG40034.1 hypothetical protein [Chelativorans sp. ZYF759]